VKDSSDIWRRDYNTIGFALIGNRSEKPIPEPIIVPFILNVGGIVPGCNLHENQINKNEGQK
jgi:hypothetical protein